MTVSPTIRPLEECRFDALAGYTRQPLIVQIVQEFDWMATTDERVLGVLTWDRIDHDFGWVALGRDERLRFRAIQVNASLPSADEAKAQLVAAMAEQSAKPDGAFHQGDAIGRPVDFFTAVVADDRLNRSFRILTGHERYSPARELIAAMMPFYEDVDGNFIEQFQTTAFDARLWELYLFAAFNELGYARSTEVAVPDFLLTSALGRLGVEATTINAPNSGHTPMVESSEQIRAYLEGYIPIKLARTLKRKLNRRKPYWETPELRDTPFILAVQDFHGPGVMRTIVPAATEYVFGVRHSLSDGKPCIERITEHRFGDMVERSSFFTQSGAENISAVVVNPQGTLTKFNRMGYLAGFGSRRVLMVRTGCRRGEHDSDGPMPKSFRQNVHQFGYRESWVEGMVVLHNPDARIPLDPLSLPGAAHEFLKDDGRIMSIVPEFHPLFSQTQIYIEGEEGNNAP